MPRVFESLSAENAVAAGTYPEMASPATSLYRRILYEVNLAGEPVDFDVPVGLDVGSYDGGYRSVIGALGAKRVVSVEPNCQPLNRGIAEGVIPADDAFNGTLQAWHTNPDSKPAGAVFVFNMMPGLPNDHAFVEALASVVAAGGILVASFREPVVSHQFHAALRNSQFRLRHLHSDLPRRNQPQFDGIRNKFIYLWRKE